MEFLPTEILEHIFNQFINKCEKCQRENCFLAPISQELLKCHDVCARWNDIIKKKFKKIERCTHSILAHSHIVNYRWKVVCIIRCPSPKYENGF